ncbi:MAG: peptidase U32, partial [Lachnospiraceae bacterium]|nr:peptidase U32 [Lachnospiraceae bacterium]
MSMKIVAGIGSIDDYENYVQAGADECFCGYVPGEYMMRYGRKYPANRREVVYYNVQIGSESELLILRKMIEKYNVPVSIAFNGLYYGDEQRAFLIDTIRKCIAMGYTDVIVAEPTLIKAL